METLWCVYWLEQDPVTNERSLHWQNAPDLTKAMEIQAKKELEGYQKVRVGRAIDLDWHPSH